MANFDSREVSWPLDDTTLYGTLVVPAGGGPHPGVVFVAGSGPTDRDWTTPLLPGSNGSGRLLAEALAEAGFASLRYDKRAAGPHAAENIQALIGKVSMASHQDELAGAVRTLAEQENVDRGRIFALTNSEGALHALNYQVHNPAVPFAGLVLTAPPGRAVGDLMRSQIAAQMQGLPNGDEVMRLFDEATSRFAAGQPMDPDPALPETLRMVLGALEAPVNLPFARELWDMDAADWLPQIQVPALVVIGKKDIQVDWQVDGGELERAAAGHSAASRTDITFRYPENANHVLKHEPKPRVEINPAEAVPTYNSPDARLDPEALDIIRGWLEEQARRRM